MSHPKVIAITLNWNKKGDTIECIKSLQNLTYPNYGILVVDNGSVDGSPEVIKNRFPDVFVVANKKNLGYAMGFNIGMKFAYQKGADYFLILNNDTIIDPEAVSELVKTAEKYENTGFVSGKVYYYDDPLKLQSAGKLNDPIKLVGRHVGFGEYDVGQYDEEREYDYIEDVFLLVKRAVYEKVGGYDENFFLQWEETDWCARVRNAEFRILYTPKAKIWHKGGFSISDDMTSSAFFYLTRNQIPFMWRNATTSQFTRFTAHLFLKEFPIEIARFFKHKKYNYIPAYLKGLITGYLWILRKS